MAEQKIPGQLAKIIADGGGAVPLLQKRAPAPSNGAVPPFQPKPGQRCCLNCYFNPSGNACQVGPMDMWLVQTSPTQGEAMPLMRRTPPSYCCSGHHYEHEIPEDRRVFWKEPAANG